MDGGTKGFEFSQPPYLSQLYQATSCRTGTWHPFLPEALMVCHQSAQTLFKIGVIDAVEMREFDEGCFVQEDKTAGGGDTIRKQAPTPAYAHPQR
jgi:hypothetical protein